MIARDRAIIERLSRIRIRDNSVSIERIRQSNRNLERMMTRWRDEQLRDEFSTFIEGELHHCDICLEEEMTNYHKCNLSHNTWCLPCHNRINNCPFCRN